MLLVSNLALAKYETLAHGYSSDSTQRELSNEYQHGKVWMVLKSLCVLVLWMKIILAFEGLGCSSVLSTVDANLCFPA